MSAAPALAPVVNPEKVVLGALTTGKIHLGDVAELRSDDFFDPRHRLIFEAIERLVEAGTPIDELTINDELRRVGMLDRIGEGYTTQLGLIYPVRDTALHYAQEVVEAGRKRRLVLAASDLVTNADRYEADELRSKLVEIAEQNEPAIGTGSTYGGDLREFLGADEPIEDPSQDYIIHGLIPRSAPFVFGGFPKQGKTLLTEDIGLAVASGAADWCGFPISEDMRGARVLIAPREDSETETRVRIWRLARGRGIDPRDLAGRLEIDGSSAMWLDDAALSGKLRRTAERFDLIIIDSLATIHRGDENSARDMGAVCSAWRDISLGTKTAIGLIHHFNGKGAEGDKRDPGHKLRGSSVIFATARHVVGVERLPKPDSAIAVRVSGNLSHIPDPFVVRRVERRTAAGKLTWGYEPLGKLGELRDPEVGDAIIAAITEAMPDGLGTRALRDRVSDRIEARATAIDAEARALSREGRIARAGSRCPWRIA